MLMECAPEANRGKINAREKITPDKLLGVGNRMTVSCFDIDT